MANPGTELASLDFGNLIGGPLVAVIKSQSLAAEATAKFIKDVGFYAPGTMSTDGNTDIGGTPIYVDFKYPKEVLPFQPGQVLFEIDRFEVVNGGTGYSASDVISFSDPESGEETATTPTFTLDGTAIDTISFPTTSTKGSYLAPPTLTITSAGGSGAEIKVIMKEKSRTSATAAMYQEMTISVPILTMLPIPFIKVDIITIDFNAKINSMETATTNTEAAVSGTLNARYGGKFTPASVSFSGSASYKKSTTTGSSVERTYSMAIHVQASQDEMPAGMEKLLNLLEGAMISKPGAITSGS